MSSPEPETLSAPVPEDEQRLASAERRARLRERRLRRGQATEGGPATPAPSEPVARPSRRSGEPRHQAPAEPKGSLAVVPKWQRGEGPLPDVHDIALDRTRLDDNAARVVDKLTRAGHEAYLVGGCVRDLLVGASPKDFDVATSASPEEVRALFRNSRIIGRRFRLVHVLFGGGQVIETATFRRSPASTEGDEEESLLIRSDNVFGEAHEDALRRDFTINGLFYDHERGRVLDWARGMPDIQSRTVRTIGDPFVRFQEDPVRILRAIKFAARLDFGMDPALYEAAVHCRGALAMAAKPRLSEEVLRLLRGGASHRSFWLAMEMGVLDVLLPEVSAFLADHVEGSLFWDVLTEIDRLTQKGGPQDDVLLWAALLLEPLSEACAGESDRLRAALDFVEPMVLRLNLPRRIADGVARTVATLPRYESGKAQRFKKSALFGVLEELAALRRRALGQDAPARRRRPDGARG
jgi:poly(A) polymerase